MKRLCCLILFLFVITVAGCSPPTGQESGEIAALSDAWEAALNAGEIDALVAMYTEDARVLPPNQELGQGRDAVRASFGGMIDAGLGGELETVEAVAAGDVGYHVGTYALTAGGAPVDRGKFVEVWRKVGGEWKIANDIWNSDMPAGPAGDLLMVTHEVKDPAHWLEAWKGPDGRGAEFQRHGANGVRVFHSPDDPKRVGLLIDVADLDALIAWIGSEEGAKAKAEDGVVEATIRMLREAR